MALALAGCGGSAPERTIDQAVESGPLQAPTSGLVETRDLGTLMGLRACLMQAGVAGFARLAQDVQGNDVQAFAYVLYLAAASQVLSYLAIRLGTDEPR